MVYVCGTHMCICLCAHCEGAQLCARAWMPGVYVKYLLSPDVLILIRSDRTGHLFKHVVPSELYCLKDDTKTFGGAALLKNDGYWG